MNADVTISRGPIPLPFCAKTWTTEASAWSWSAMKCFLVLILGVSSVSSVSSTRLQRGHISCPSGQPCRCDCAMAALAQLTSEPELLPPVAPPPLPPMPPAALPPMPTYTRMTEADLPTLGPPPPTTTMSTTMRPPPGLFAAGGNPAQMQADIMNGGFDHHFQYVPGR